MELSERPIACHVTCAPPDFPRRERTSEPVANASPSRVRTERGRPSVSNDYGVARTIPHNG